jgi:acetyltransferase-like isoleucine patch superfamily enzyme
MNKLWKFPTRFCCDHSGTIAVMTALSLTALVGFAGLGIETTQWYTEKRAIQAAADDAALSAAIAYSQGNTSGYTIEGKSVAGTDGFVDGANQVTVTVNKPPASGPYASNASAIQVIINAPAQPVLSKMFIGDFTISASSVAIPASASTNACVLALNGVATGAGTLSGTTNITLKNCSFDVNSNSKTALVLNGNSTLTASDVYVVGGDSISNNSTLTVTGNVMINTNNSMTDPYATRVIPTPAATCIDLGQIQGNVTLNPGTYCGMDIQAGANVILNPGVYILDGNSKSGGNFDIAGGGTITGTGVSIVLTTSGTAFSKVGDIVINGGSTVNLTAPDATTGLASQGIVFWQDSRKPDDGKDNFNGGSTMNLTGAIYLPSQTVSFNGGNTAGGTGCTQIVASIIVFSGNSEFDNNCAGTGVTNIPPPSQLATLAQ